MAVIDKSLMALRHVSTVGKFFSTLMTSVIILSSTPYVQSQSNDI